MITIKNNKDLENLSKLNVQVQVQVVGAHTLETHNHFWGLNIMKTFDNKLYLKNKTQLNGKVRIFYLKIP